MDSTFQPSLWQTWEQVGQSAQHLIDSFSKEYEKAKKRQGVITVNDLESYAAELLRSHPDTAQRFASEWDYWLIDEFQDTNAIQIDLLSALSHGQPQFMVGDPQQSIYFFRGARSEVFEKKFLELEQKKSIDLLQTNYRSQSSVMEFINEVMAMAPNTFAKMSSAKKSDVKSNSATFLLADKKRSSDLAEENLDSELLLVRAKILELIAQNVDLEKICVLSRANKNLKRLAGYLREAQVPLHLHSSQGFFERREVRDLVHFLKFLAHPFDNYNLLCLLRSPWFFVSDIELAEVCQTARGYLWSELIDLKKHHTSVVALSSYLNLTQTRGFGEILLLALKERGIVDLSHFCDTSGRREANIWKFVAQLFKEERQNGFRILEFIEKSESDLGQKNIDASDSDAIAVVEPQRVNLMTVHAAKGLEFDYVFILGAGEKPQLTNYLPFAIEEHTNKWSFALPENETHDKFTSINQKKWIQEVQNKELEEHWRVFYVALTRSIQHIYISGKKPFDKTSWLAGLNLDYSTGEHAIGNTRYSVIEHVDEIDAVKRPSSSSAPSLRVPWQNRTHQQERVSVTEILSSSTAAPSYGDPIMIYDKVKKGIETHFIFEILNLRGEEIAQEIIENLPEDQREPARQAMQYVLKLKNPPMHELLQTGFAEWGFILPMDGRIIEGQIDLWGKIEKGGRPEFWIADYKTGSPAHSEEAFAQLKIYAQAVQKSKFYVASSPIHLAVIYPYIAKTLVRPFDSTASS